MVMPVLCLLLLSICDSPAEVLAVQQATFDMEIKHAEADEKKAQDVLAHASFERDKAIRKLKRGHVALERAQV